MQKTNNPIRENLTSTQVFNLALLLESSGFKLGIQGHIDVMNVKPEHPRDQETPLPIGYLNKVAGKAYLVNQDKTFPEPYHEQLKEIYKKV